MLKKLSIILVVFTVVFNVVLEKAYASDWPSDNFDLNLNRAVVDTVVNDKIESSYFDSDNYVTKFVSGDGMVFYTAGATNSYQVYAYSMSKRNLVWSKEVPKNVRELVYHDHKLYFGSDNIFYSLDANTGSEVWTNSFAQENVLQFYAVVHQVDDQRVYAMKSSPYLKYLYVLDRISGEVIFKSPSGIGEFIADVGVTPSKIYIQTDQSDGADTYTIAYSQSDFSYSRTARSCPDGHSMILDPESNTLFVTSEGGAFCAYDMNDLSEKYSGSDRYYGLIKYGNTFYSVYDRAFKTVKISGPPYSSTTKNVLTSPDKFLGEPLVVNGVLYAFASNGKIWSKNLETGESKLTQAIDNFTINGMIYVDSHLIVKGKNTDNQNRIYLLNINDLTVKPKYQITIANPYNTVGTNQYLGQLHSHWIPDVIEWNVMANGIITPEFTVNAYDEKGYDFMALTEHNKIVEMPFVDQSRIMQIQNAEEDTQGKSGNHILSIGVTNPIDENLSDQERIDQVVNQGGIPILAHPNAKDYPFTLDKLFSLKNYNTIEALNGSIYYWRAGKVRLGSGTSFDKIDQLISKKKSVFIAASDDYTPGDGGLDGGAVVVLSPSNTQADILANLKAGNFYAVQGSKAPRLNISFDPNANELTVSSSELSTFKFIGKDGKELQKQKSVDNSMYKMWGDEGYVRVEVESKQTGLKSWTQPVIVDKNIDMVVAGAGKHVLAVGDMILGTDSEKDTRASFVPINKLPDTMPPAGHLSDVVSLQTEGGVGVDTYISYSYRNINLPTNENNLCVYTYSEEYGKWLPVPSTVNPEAKTVISYLPHYSMYTLSAEVPEDTEAPTLELISPVDLPNLAGTIELQVSSNDNQATTGINFSIDNKYLGYDINGSDGWRASFETADFTSGVHTLKISAEDYSGNTLDKEYNINISGGIAVPTISIVSPNSSEYLSGASNLIGEYFSTYNSAGIEIYLNNLFIGYANEDLVNGKYSKEIDWSQYKDGQYTLNVVFTDVKGNIVDATSSVTVGNLPLATIISPVAKTYSWSEELPIQVDTKPSGAAIIIMLDGKEVANGSTIRLAEHSKGGHKIEVKFQDTILNTIEFNIVINYSDVRIMMDKLYKEKHITNYNIMKSIQIPLNFAEYLVAKNRLTNVNNYLSLTVTLLKMQARFGKPFFDKYATEILIRGIEGLKI